MKRRRLEISKAKQKKETKKKKSTVNLHSNTQKIVNSSSPPRDFSHYGFPRKILDSSVYCVEFSFPVLH